MILHKETILKNISEVECYENMFNEEEISTLWKLAFDGGVVRKNSLGNIFIKGNVVRRAYDLIKDKISLNAELAFGNYFIATEPYGLHLDSFKKEIEKDDGTTVYKNVLIPLWIGGSNNGGQIIFFEQRLIDYGCAFNKGGSTEYKQSQYKVYTDYSNLQFYNKNLDKIEKRLNHVPFSTSFYFDYLEHIEYDRLDGLTVEGKFDWTPGNMLIFDAVQIHASNKPANSWTNKMGLLLNFKVKI